MSQDGNFLAVHSVLVPYALFLIYFQVIKIP